APSHKREVKSAASRLTLTVVVELSNAARAASTVRVILPSLLFLRATTISSTIYNTPPLYEHQGKGIKKYLSWNYEKMRSGGSGFAEP
ncbi:MAG: hypothetical protein IKR64_06340, partial [Treponema sp.]|nr:hypothetical protein [Treponema sp.]